MCWLQDAVDAISRAWHPDTEVEYDCGDLWDDMEDWMLQSEGIDWVLDPLLGNVYFLCDDGLLSTILETGADGETVWIVPEFDIDIAVQEAELSDVNASVRRFKASLSELVAFKNAVTRQCKTTPADVAEQLFEGEV